MNRSSKVTLLPKRSSRKKGRVRPAQESETVCLLGLGYVGLTLGLTLSEVGVSVHGIEKDQRLLDTLNDGRSHFYEKGLDRLLKKYLGNRFRAVLTIPSDERFGIYIISVGTPITRDREPNLSAVKETSEMIGKRLEKENLVILRSTVPVGTTRRVVIPILESKSGLKAGRDFSIVFAPERTIEGKALQELRELPQIIGAIDDKSLAKATHLFRRTTPTIINVSSLEGAEMIKIMDNTYRDIHFSIANELALICEKLGLDAVELIRAANEGYNRTNIPAPSPGVGGACLSKDPYMLDYVAKKAGYEAELVRLGRAINEKIPGHVAQQVKEFLRTEKKGKKAKIFIIGFAFKGKPITSDMRYSPTCMLVDALKELPGRLFGFDLAASQQEIRALGVTPCTIEEGFQDADCIVLMLNSEPYAELDIFSLLEKTCKPVLFFDGWQLFQRDEIKQIEGIRHRGVGFYE